jgi:hypothetical protein
MPPMIKKGRSSAHVTEDGQIYVKNRKDKIIQRDNAEFLEGNFAVTLLDNRHDMDKIWYGSASGRAEFETARPSDIAGNILFQSIRKIADSGFISLN